MEGGPGRLAGLKARHYSRERESLARRPCRRGAFRGGRDAYACGRLFWLEREGGEVNVAAGEDDAEFWRGAVGAGGKMESGDGAWLQQGSDGYGAAGLDDDFHALPDEAHRGDDFLFGDEDDPIEMLSENREGARGQGRPEAVGDGVAGVDGLESAGGQGSVGVIGAGRLAAEDMDTGPEAFCGEAGAAEETAAADWGDYGVEVGDFFEEFFGGGGLPSDDAVVVVGMDERGTSVGLNAGGVFLAGSDGGFGEGDFSAITFDGAAFYFGRVFRHDDVRGDTAPCCRAGDGSAVIAAGGSDDAVGGFRAGERKNGVGGAANFEGAGFLKILALEEELGAGHGVERVRSENGGAVDARGDACVGFYNILPSGSLKI